jgi:hypothetical protein
MSSIEEALARGEISAQQFLTLATKFMQVLLTATDTELGEMTGGLASAVKTVNAETLPKVDAVLGHYGELGEKLAGIAADLRAGKHVHVKGLNFGGDLTIAGEAWIE